MAIQIQLRHDTGTNWESADPILAAGEIGINTDNGGFKVGDGTSLWSELIYVTAAMTDAINVGSTGLTVFKGLESGTLEFKKVTPGSDKIALTDLESGDLLEIDLGTVNLTDISDVDLTGLTSNKSIKWNGSNWVVAEFEPADATIVKEWNPDTNTPTLTDGSGVTGKTYICSHSGSVDLGSGSISFEPGNLVQYDGAVWTKIEDETLTLAGTGSADSAARSDHHHHWTPTTDYTTGDIVIDSNTGLFYEATTTFTSSSDIQTDITNTNLAAINGITYDDQTTEGVFELNNGSKIRISENFTYSDGDTPPSYSKPGDIFITVS